MSVAPSVTYKDFLTTLASDLATEYSTYKVTLEPHPIYRGYGDVKMTVCPAEPCIEYIDTGAATKTERSYWVWYYARVFAFVALTDKNHEYAIKGVGSKVGLVEALETAYEHLVGNFLSLSLVREVNVLWDNPAIYSYPIFEFERDNAYAAMGSFIYKAKLKQVASTEEQATPPTISNVQSSPGISTCDITWDTDKDGTSLVKYGEGEWPPDWADATEETSTYQTSHSVELTGLADNTTHYYKPWSASKEGWYGQTATTYNFTTDIADIEFSTFDATKVFGILVVYWTNNIATKRKLKWRIKDSSNDWTYANLTGSYQITSGVGTTIPDTPSKAYEFYPYAITEGGTEEWGAMRYLYVTEQGTIYFELAE